MGYSYITINLSFTRLSYTKFLFVMCLFPSSHCLYLYYLAIYISVRPTFCNIELK